MIMPRHRFQRILPFIGKIDCDGSCACSTRSAAARSAARHRAIAFWETDAAGARSTPDGKFSGKRWSRQIMTP